MSTIFLKFARDLKNSIMKRNVILFVIMLAVAQFTFAQVKWEADPMHSNARFEVQHTGISFIDGDFKDISGTIESKSEDNFEGAEFNFTIEANSVDTRIKARDELLFTDGFFNAEKYPKITLKNAKLSKKNGNNYTLKGDLTIRDVTKTVSFDVVYNGNIKDDKGLIHAGFTATTTIDRTD